MDINSHAPQPEHVTIFPSQSNYGAPKKAFRLQSLPQNLRRSPGRLWQRRSHGQADIFSSFSIIGVLMTFQFAIWGDCYIKMLFSTLGQLLVRKFVGMKSLERSLERLDDVRRKKLSEMIESSGGESAGTSSVTVQSSAGSTATWLAVVIRKVKEVVSVTGDKEELRS